MKRLFAFFSIIITLFFVGCSDSNKPTPLEGITKVLLVYMGGDNNLASETDHKIAAIMQGWDKNLNHKIVIYQDAYGTPPALFEIAVTETGAKILIKLEQYTEENSASPEVFGRVVSKVRSDYPTASHSLLIFSHASGWLPKGTLAAPRSPENIQYTIINDGTEEMDIKDFARSIPDGAFRHITMEACLMSDIGTLFELRNKAEYLLTSAAEIVSPGFTKIYPQHINLLLNDRVTDFAKEAFRYMNEVDPWKSGTFSVVRTDKLGQLAEWIKANCDLDRSVAIAEIQHFDRLGGGRRVFFDFEDYFSRLLLDGGKAGELQNLIRQCVVWQGATESFLPSDNGFIINKHSGITTYIPQTRYPFLNEEYTKLEWMKELMK